jgi:MFS family permease
MRTTPAPARRSPVHVPVFRAVWFSTLISNLGVLIQSVGASWMMTTLAASPQMIALVQSANSLPIMLLSLGAGAISDNMDRRKVMLSAQVFLLVISIVLAVFAYKGWLNPWLLLGFTALIGCGTALNGPSWQASVGDMVPREILTSAVSYNNMGFNIARSAGPALGGAIVIATGVSGAFLFNALSKVGLIFVLMRWRPNQRQLALPRERLHSAMYAGLRYVVMSPKILVVLLRVALFAIGASCTQALLPLVARDLVSGGAMTYGMLLGAFGAGGVAGGLSSALLQRHLSNELIVRWASTAVALGAAVAGYSRSLSPTICALALAGAGWVSALSTFNVSVQLTSPRWVVGRSIAMYQMGTFGGVALGSWVFGTCADRIGAESTLYASAIALIVVVFVGLFCPMPKVSGTDLDPQSGWRAPELALEIEHRSGPIVISVEHAVAPVDTTKFLAAMSERRRIRRRDGARNWTLLRDLGDSDLWVERYELPTWLDYLRHIERRTHADIDNSQLLRALRKNEVELQVRRLIEHELGSPPITPATSSSQEGNAATSPEEPSS